MPSNNKKNNSADIYWFLVVVVLVLIGLAAYQDVSILSGQSGTFSGSKITFSIVDQTTINGLTQLQKCGQWPVVPIGPESGRGDPFHRQTLAVPLSTVTSSAGCFSPLNQ